MRTTYDNIIYSMYNAHCTYEVHVHAVCTTNKGNSTQGSILYVTPHKYAYRGYLYCIYCVYSIHFRTHMQDNLQENRELYKLQKYATRLQRDTLSFTFSMYL
jgi:hypothetical protein